MQSLQDEHSDIDVLIAMSSEQEQQRQDAALSRLKDRLEECEGLLYQPLFTNESAPEHKRFTSDSFSTLSDTGFFDVASILRHLQATPSGAQVVATLSPQFLHDLFTCVNAKVVEGRHRQRSVARQHSHVYQYIWTHTWQWVRFRSVMAFVWIIVAILQFTISKDTMLFVWIWAALYVTVLLLDWRATTLRRQLPDVVCTINTALASSIHQVYYFQQIQTHIFSPWWRRLFRKSNNSLVAPDDTETRKVIARADFAKSNCWFKMLLEISTVTDDFHTCDLGTEMLQLCFKVGLAAACINCQTPQEQTVDDSSIPRYCAQCGFRYQGDAGYCACEFHVGPTPFCTACGGLRHWWRVT